MGSDFRRGPNLIHPETPSAVGSRNSVNRDDRDEYVESRSMIDEEVDKILNHIQAKLPPEVLQDMTVQGNVKSHLHTYFNQSMQNMLSRYLTTVEDEMSKKVRDMVDKEEHHALNRYTPREVAGLLNQMGGADFNTAEVEKSTVNIMGHLQGHVARGSADFENATIRILTRQSDVGGFINGANAYAVVRASFHDNVRKPEEVVDIDIAINVLESELISPIVHHLLPTEFLIKDVVAKRLRELVDKEIDEINRQLEGEGRKALSPNEAVFEKLKAVEQGLAVEDGDNALINQLLSQDMLERIRNITPDLRGEGADPLTFEVASSEMLEHEALRTRGWYTAINSITSILDNCRMGYQHIENYRLARKMVLREYESTLQDTLPDERFEIYMEYVDADGMRAQKAAYTAQLLEFQREIMRLWNVVEQVYLEEKTSSHLRDWGDVVSETVGRGGSGWFHRDESVEPNRKWNEVVFIQRELSTLEEMNRTYEELSTEFRERFLIIRRRLTQIFGKRHPVNREVVESRLFFLEDEFIRFSSVVNPYHLQPGLMIQLKLTSIKRRQVTVAGMSNVMSEFLSRISSGYRQPVVTGSRRHANIKDEGSDAFGGEAANS